MIDPNIELQVDQIEAFKTNIDRISQNPNPLGSVVLNEAWSVMAMKMCDELIAYKKKYPEL